MTNEEVRNITNNFISKFHFSDNINEVFTNGCCYWFARILCDWAKFYDKDIVNCDIMYDPVSGHFGTRINYNIYDITGDVTDKYFWITWMSVCKTDNLQAERIIRDCIKMEETKDE